MRAEGGFNVVGYSAGIVENSIAKIVLRLAVSRWGGAQRKPGGGIDDPPSQWR
jgi:hypothetical protein